MAKKMTPKKQTPNESLEQMVKRSEVLRNGKDFKKFLDFISKFKHYKPYNNMLIYTQNPNCMYYATENNYNQKFDRTVKEDARPMIILAPMSPVLFVYDIKDTEGEDLPEKFYEDAYTVYGYYKEKWFDNITSHFAHLKISAKEVKMPDIQGGSIERKSNGAGFQIIINSNHEPAVKLSTIVHELAHLLLGHLGSNIDEKYPDRVKTSTKIKEIEAESVAYLVLKRLNLDNNAHEYLAFYNANTADLRRVSVDFIINIAGKIEDMIMKPFKAKK